VIVVPEEGMTSKIERAAATRIGGSISESVRGSMAFERAL